MKEKKNIDRLFQENFKDFEVSPKNRVWKNIEKELQQKEDNKVVPIWWFRIAGVAAILAVAFFAGNQLLNNAQENEVVTSPTNVQPEDIQSIEKPFTNSLPSEKTGSQPATNLESPVTGIKEATVHQDHKTQTPNPEESYQQRASNTNPTLKANSGQVAGNNPTVDKSTPFHGKEFASTGKIIGKEKGADYPTTKKEEQVGNTLQNENASVVSSESISAEKYVPKENSAVNKKLAEINEETPNNPLLNNEELASLGPDEEKEKSLVEEATKIEEEKTLENMEEGNQEENLSKWLISPNVSPIYYGSLNGGNSIDKSLANNASSGEVSMAYGVNFAYAISEKLKVRSGVSKVNMSYNVNDIAYNTGVNAIQLEGINTNPQNETLEVTSKFSTNNLQSLANSEFGRATIAPRTEGTLNQQLGYIEVPLELEYTLLNKRFGVNVIGGASTLILEENNIGIRSENGYLDIGEANNLNNVSFTTNVGLGFGYKLNKKFDLNLEPTFKYQLNTYSNNINNFKPYYFGVYTGFSFKF